VGHRIAKDLVGRETSAGPVPKALRPIFRDREDFSAGHSLTEQTNAALEASQFLVVICSPSSARSPYVNEEIRRFKALGRAKHIIALIVAGEPGDAENDCFPPALRYAVDADGSISDRLEEPIAADAREQGDGKDIARLKVVAGLLGLRLDEVVRRAERARKRRNRIWSSLAGAFLILAVAATGSAAYAWQQLKTNEAFLNATLKRATEIVDEAVQQAERYKVPRTATLALLAKAEGLFDDMATYGRPTAQIRYRKAWMLIQFARSYEVLGDTSEQLARAEEAYRLLSALAAEQPDDSVFQIDLSTAYDEIGNVMLARGDLAGALKSYRDSLAIRERLLQSDPENDRWQFLFSAANTKVGDIRKEQGDLAGALESYRVALVTLERLAESKPHSPTVLLDLSTAHERVGNVLFERGDLPGALKSYSESLTIRERLAKSAPGSPRLQLALAVAYVKIGDVRKEQGELTKALEHFRRMLAIVERLVQSDPDDAGLQRHLAMAHQRVGDVLDDRGDHAGALESFRILLATMERLARSDPGNAVWQRDLSLAHEKVGDVQFAQSDCAGALEHYRDCVAIMTRLTQAEPGNASWQLDLWRAFDRVGDVQREQGDLAGALKSYSDGLAITQRLTLSDPGNADWQRSLAVAYGHMGDVRLKQGDFAEALRSYRDALAIMQRLVQSDPGNAVWQNHISHLYRTIGEVQDAQGDLAAALASYRSSLAIDERWSQTDPVWQRDLKAIVIKIGGLAYRLMLAHDFASALEAADQAVALAADEAFIHMNRAHALMFLGRADESRAIYLRHRGENKMSGGRTWDAVVLKDFTEMRRTGLAHPLMDEVEALFTPRG
jgi:tetratricopeptide (TPR) repeat protein